MTASDVTRVKVGLGRDGMPDQAVYCVEGGKMRQGIDQRPATSVWSLRLAVLVPGVWLAVFFLVPFLIVFKLSLSRTAMAQPP